MDSPPHHSNPLPQPRRSARIARSAQRAKRKSPGTLSNVTSVTRSQRPGNVHVSNRSKGEGTGSSKGKRPISVAKKKHAGHMQKTVANSVRVKRQPGRFGKASASSIVDNRLPKRMGGEHCSRVLPPPTPTSCKTRSRFCSKSVMVRKTARTPLPRSRLKTRLVLSETRVLYTSPFREIDPLLGEEGHSDEQFRRRKRSTKETYDYITVLGDGVCGVVHEVRSKLDGKLYALKRYKRPFTSLSERRKILSAMTVWSEIRPHQNVVPLYRAWQEDGFLCMQMQLCNGGNLHHHVERSRGLGSHVPSVLWNEGHLWRCLRDSLMALAHIHSQGFVHNDVKPGNLYIAQDSRFGVRVMLGDFDKVTRLDGFSIGDEGDARYMAKEILEEKCSSASDLFSLGISFYQLACDAELPENGKLWHMLRDGKIPRFSADEYSEDLYKCLVQLMSPEPEKRSQAAVVLQAEPRLISAEATELPIYDFVNGNAGGSPCYEMDEIEQPSRTLSFEEPASSGSLKEEVENVDPVESQAGKKSVENDKEVKDSLASSDEKNSFSGSAKDSFSGSLRDSLSGSVSVSGSEADAGDSTSLEVGRKTPRRSLFSEFEGMDKSG